MPQYLKREQQPDTTLHVVCVAVNEPVSVDGRKRPRARVSQLLLYTF